MTNHLINNNHQETFESIKHINENGNEYWLARELSKVLGYSEYRNFQPVIGKAKEACKNSGYNPFDHFVDINEMVKIGLGAKRSINDIQLSRYACYLFRATQTEEKLKRDNVRGKQNANSTHYEVGKKVRKTIEELGGTMPENLPTPKKGIRQLETEKMKAVK